MSEIKTMDVTPRFDYQEHTEIIKRFVEKLSRMANEIAVAPKDEVGLLGAMADFVAVALPHVRPAVSELLADDVLVQIKNGTFPVRSDLSIHAFTPYEAPNQDVCQECGMFNVAKPHIFA